MQGIRTGVIVAACACALAAAAPAHGAVEAKVVTVDKTTQLLRSQGGDAVATCPKGMGVISGGFDAEPHGGPGLEGGVVNESRRLGDNRWTVSGANLSLTEEGSLTAYAVCSADAPDLVTERRSVQFPGDFARRTIVAECDDGRRAVSGGFSTSLLSVANSVLIQTSRRAGPDAWMVGAGRASAATYAAEVATLVNCAREKVAGDSNIRRVSGFGTIGTAKSPACDDGTALASGGFMTDPFSVPTTALTVMESRPAGGEWVSTARQDYPGTGVVESFGYCVRRG